MKSFVRAVGIWSARAPNNDIAKEKAKSKSRLTPHIVVVYWGVLCSQEYDLAQSLVPKW